MDISPGTELVWRLAAAEAIAARRERIEPDHFFCALLKFSEVGTKELGVAAAHPLAKVLMSEHDRVQAVLKELSLPTTRVRRQLRGALGRGTYEHKGEVVHRSTASRQLFNRAARAALKDKGVLASRREGTKVFYQLENKKVTQVLNCVYNHCQAKKRKGQQ